MTIKMDEQLYLKAIGTGLPEKVELAIATLRHYETSAIKENPDGFWLCDSYGKDSCVILHLAQRSGVRFVAHHNLTTLDPPELIQFGRKHHPDTVVHKPEMSMLARLASSANRGPPTRLKRWCCAEYKESSCKGVLMFGVRAAESIRRKANWKVFQPGLNGKRGQWILNPILFWTDDDVWRYIKENNIPYCSLYDEGFTRLGCIGCPMAGQKRVAEFRRWPKHEKAWQRAFEKWWKNWNGSKRKDGDPRWFNKPRKDGSYFTKWQDIWAWWMEETTNESDDDGCQMGLF